MYGHLDLKITEFLSIISEIQREQIREHNKSDFFPSLLLQSYPSGVCPYMHLQYCWSKVYHRLPSQKYVKCSRVSYLFNVSESKHRKCSAEYCHVKQGLTNATILCIKVKVIAVHLGFIL